MYTIINIILIALGFKLKKSNIECTIGTIINKILIII